ncbi:MAG: hypothetical protein AAGI91_00370 [Bacteroidota bacterium]
MPDRGAHRCRICSRLRPTLVLALLAFGFAADALAQRETVGSIEEIGRDRRSVDSTDAVRLTSTPVYTRKPARRQDALHIGELVELLEPYYVRANLSRGTTRTRLFAGSSGASINVFELEERGAYEILPGGVDPLSGLELRIRHGVMVLEHAAGRLDVWVDSTLMRIFGTTVLIAADSASTEAFCFLQQGHVAFPDYGIDARGSDVMWRLRAGAAPERIGMGAVVQEQFRQEIRHITHEVWPVAFWRKPGFYLPVGAAVLGAGLYFLLRPGGGDGRSGDVLIRLPG